MEVDFSCEVDFTGHGMIGGLPQRISSLVRDREATGRRMRGALINVQRQRD